MLIQYTSDNIDVDLYLVNTNTSKWKILQIPYPLKQHLTYWVDWKGLENIVTHEKMLLRSEHWQHGLTLFRQQDNFNLIKIFLQNYKCYKVYTLTHMGKQTPTYRLSCTLTHTHTHKIESAILNFWMDQSLVVAIVKTMSISGIVKQLSIVSKVFLYLFFLRKRYRQPAKLPFWCAHTPRVQCASV